MKGYGDLESKFRFVILASMRAKQLLRGAKPKIKTKSKNLIRIAQQEVEQGLINYEFVEQKDDNIEVVEDDMFIGEDVGGPGLDIGEPFSLENIKLDDTSESPEEEAIRKAVLEAVKDSRKAKADKKAAEKDTVEIETEADEEEDLTEEDDTEDEEDN